MGPVTVDVAGRIGHRRIDLDKTPRVTGLLGPCTPLSGWGRLEPAPDTGRVTHDLRRARPTVNQLDENRQESGRRPGQGVTVSREKPGHVQGKDGPLDPSISGVNMAPSHSHPPHAQAAPLLPGLHPDAALLSALWRWLLAPHSRRSLCFAPSRHLPPPSAHTGLCLCPLPPAPGPQAPSTPVGRPTPARGRHSAQTRRAIRTLPVNKTVRGGKRAGMRKLRSAPDRKRAAALSSLGAVGPGHQQNTRNTPKGSAPSGTTAGYPQGEQVVRGGFLEEAASGCLRSRLCPGGRSHNDPGTTSAATDELSREGCVVEGLPLTHFLAKNGGLAVVRKKLKTY